jgi:hypothetical protein
MTGRSRSRGPLPPATGDIFSPQPVFRRSEHESIGSSRSDTAWRVGKANLAEVLAPGGFDHPTTSLGSTRGHKDFDLLNGGCLAFSIIRGGSVLEISLTALASVAVLCTSLGKPELQGEQAPDPC